MVCSLIHLRSFRRLLVGSYGIDDTEMDFHIYNQNKAYNGSRDVLPYIWRGLASVRQSLELNSSIYYVCFAKREE